MAPKAAKSKAADAVVAFPKASASAMAEHIADIAKECPSNAAFCAAATAQATKLKTAKSPEVVDETLAWMVSMLSPASTVSDQTTRRHVAAIFRSFVIHEKHQKALRGRPALCKSHVETMLEWTVRAFPDAAAVEKYLNEREEDLDQAIRAETDIGQLTLEDLARAYKPSFVWGVAKEYIAKYKSSAEERRRESTMSVVEYLAEPCMKSIKASGEELNALVSSWLLPVATADPSPVLRVAALRAIRELLRTQDSICEKYGSQIVTVACESLGKEVKPLVLNQFLSTILMVIGADDDEDDDEDEDENEDGSDDDDDDESDDDDEADGSEEKETPKWLLDAAELSTKTILSHAGKFVVDTVAPFVIDSALLVIGAGFQRAPEACAPLAPQAISACRALQASSTLMEEMRRQALSVACVLVGAFKFTEANTAKFPEVLGSHAAALSAGVQRYYNKEDPKMLCEVVRMCNNACEGLLEGDVAEANNGAAVNQLLDLLIDVSLLEPLESDDEEESDEEDEEADEEDEDEEDDEDTDDEPTSLALEVLGELYRRMKPAIRVSKAARIIETVRHGLACRISDEVRCAALSVVNNLVGAKWDTEAQTADMVQRIIEIFFPIVNDMISKEESDEVLFNELATVAEIVQNSPDGAISAKDHAKLTKMCVDNMNQTTARFFACLKDLTAQQKKKINAQQGITSPPKGGRGGARRIPKAGAQQDSDEDDDDDNIEERFEAMAQREGQLLEYTINLLSEMAKRFKASYIESRFVPIVLPVLKSMFATPKPLPDDFLTGLLGLAADVLELNVEAAIPVGVELSDAIIKNASSEDASLRQTSYFCMVVAARLFGSQNTAAFAGVKTFAQMAAKAARSFLRSPISKKRENISAACNAVSAMIALVDGFESVVEGKTALADIVGHLPVSGDKLEAVIVHDALCRWIATKKPFITPETRTALCAALGKTKLVSASALASTSVA